jgi:hypothetical protein
MSQEFDQITKDREDLNRLILDELKEQNGSIKELFDSRNQIKEEIQTLRMVVLGVDGQNGLRNSIKDLKEEIKDLRGEIAPLKKFKVQVITITVAAVAALQVIFNIVYFIITKLKILE